MIALLVSGCFAPEREPYRVPAGEGDIRWSPDRGIHRVGAPLDVSEEYQFRRGLVAFDDREYPLAARLLREFRQSDRYVDSGRALDAIVLEAVAQLESGRNAPPAWMLRDLGAAYLDLDEDAVRRLPIEYVRAGGHAEVVALAKRLYNSGAVTRSFEVTKEILNYYTAGLGASPALLQRICAHCRDLAWFAYCAEEYRLAEEIANFLVERNPRASIRERTRLILAQSLDQQGWYERSIVIYRDLAETAREIALREEALLAEVKAIIRTSKGWEYSAEPYALALNRINEYKAEFLVIHPDAALVAEFARLEREVNDVLFRQEREAANAYQRLFEQSAAKYHEIRAERVAQIARRQERFLSERIKNPSEAQPR